MSLNAKTNLQISTVANLRNRVVANGIVAGFQQMHLYLALRDVLERLALLDRAGTPQAFATRDLHAPMQPTTSWFGLRSCPIAVRAYPSTKRS